MSTNNYRCNICSSLAKPMKNIVIYLLIWTMKDNKNTFLPSTNQRQVNTWPKMLLRKLEWHILAQIFQNFFRSLLGNDINIYFILTSRQAFLMLLNIAVNVRRKVIIFLSHFIQVKRKSFLLACQSNLITKQKINKTLLHNKLP